MKNIPKLVFIVGASLVAILIPATRNFILGLAIGVLLTTTYLYVCGSTLKWEK